MKRQSLVVSSIVFAIVLGVAMGCAKKPDDGKISSEIQSRFSQDSGLSSKQLTVQSAGGVVTLSGQVDNEAQRDAASRQAASVAGVKEVVNNLVVGTAVAAAPVPAATAAPAAETASSSQPASAAASSTTPATAASNAMPADKGKRAAGTARRSRQKDSAGAGNSPQDADAQTANNQSAPPPQENDSANAGPAPPEEPAAAAEAPAPPSPKKLIIDEGTQITVRLIDPIDSEKNQAGDTFHATLNAPLTSDGEEAVPAGVELTGHLVEVKSATKFAGQSVVAIQLDSLTSGGKTYNLQTDQYKKEGSARGKNTAEKVGGGAILGGIIGAIAGGGKGAAIGAAAGAGAGGAVQAAGKSQQIKLPSETVLNFTLQAPITVVQAPSADAGRQKLDSQ